MKLLRTSVAAFTVLLTTVFLPSTTYAVSNSLGVNPRRDYSVKIGEKISDSLFVRNLSKTDDLNVKIDLIDFQAQNETGSPALLLNETKPTRWSLKPYITIQGATKIAAGQSADVPFTITIPSSVGPGSYYSAIRYSALGAGGGSNLNLSSSSTTLVFVRVPGQANDSLQMTAFGAFTPSNDGNTGTFGTFYGATAPKYLAYALKNAGNVAEQPTGSIMITDMFGKQVKLYQEANPNKNIVLIGQTRRIDFCLNPQEVSKTVNGVNTKGATCSDYNFKPGHYTAALDLFYGTEGSSAREIKATASFWYLPTWFIIAVIATILILAGIVWLVIHSIRNARGRKYQRR